MRFVVHIKVMDDTNITERATNSIDNENQTNQEAENLIGESSTQDDDAIKIHKSCDKHVNRNPDSNPSVHTEKRDIQ